MNHLIGSALSLILCLAGFSQAQAPSSENREFALAHKEEAKQRVIRLIESGSAPDRAWAAHFIGQYELKELAPILFELLEAPDSSTRVHNAALNSLIRLNLNTPPAIVMPLYQRFPDEVLILLARLPAENREALLSIAETPERDVCWVTACNLLAQIKAPGFAALLLKKLELKAQITVSDSGRMGYGSGGGIGGCSECGGEGQPGEYPPYVYYQLTTAPQGEAVLVAPGLHPVHYERRESNRRATARTASYSMDRNIYSIEYFAAMIGKEIIDVKLKDLYRHRIKWAGRVEYISEIERIKQGIKIDFEYMKDELLEKGLLTADEWDASKLNLSIFVVDTRKSKVSPLPEIPGVKESSIR